MAKPNFIIIGTEKGGSTWLYDVLCAHPDVFLPDIKELHFFNRFNSNGHEIDQFARYGLDWYWKFFNGSEGFKAVGEATPLYLSDDFAAARVQEALPDVRLIAVLRHPVDRFRSHYRMATAKGHISTSVRDTFSEHSKEFLERGLYAKHLKRWFKYFPREQFLILNYSDLCRDPAELLKTVAEWLEISEGPLLEASPEDRRNAATGYRSAKFYNFSVSMARRLRQNRATSQFAKLLKATGAYHMIKALNRAPADQMNFNDADLEWLQDYYVQDISELYSLLGVDFGWIGDPQPEPMADVLS